MSNKIKLVDVEKLQVENILLKMEVASKEIDKQRTIIGDFNRLLSQTIAVLRVKYGLGSSWKLDTINFELVNTEKEELVKLEPEQEETKSGE